MLEKTTQYAIKALLLLAKQDTEVFVQVSKLSVDANVPGPYLSKIMKTLAIKGIVLTRKGINGGVKITPRIRELSFYDICAALDDPVVHSQCLLNNLACSRTSPCSFHTAWAELREQVAKHLSQLKLNA